jgi:hypothetical protein
LLKQLTDSFAVFPGYYFAVFAQCDNAVLLCFMKSDYTVVAFTADSIVLLFVAAVGDSVVVADVADGSLNSGGCG